MLSNRPMNKWFQTDSLTDWEATPISWPAISGESERTAKAPWIHLCVNQTGRNGLKVALKTRVWQCTNMDRTPPSPPTVQQPKQHLSDSERSLTLNDKSKPNLYENCIITSLLLLFNTRWGHCRCSQPPGGVQKVLALFWRNGWAVLVFTVNWPMAFLLSPAPFGTVAEYFLHAVTANKKNSSSMIQTGVGGLRGFDLF